MPKLLQNKEAYQYFQQTVKKWSALLCPDYEVRTKYAPLVIGVFADADTSHEDKTCKITFSSRNKALSRHFIDVTAFHEVMEGIFNVIDERLTVMYSDEYVNTLIHDVIIRLEKMIKE